MSKLTLQLCGVPRCNDVRPTTRANGLLLPFCVAHWQRMPAALKASLLALMLKGKAGRWEVGDSRAFNRLRGEALRVIRDHDQEGKTA